jgi:hypothetical protein
VADADQDKVSNVTDNCLHMPNDTQLDRGGLGAGLQFGDGTGDLCQCGEVSGDGEILEIGASDDGDIDELLDLLTGLGTSGTPAISGDALDRCNVSGDTPSAGDDPKSCDIKDAVVVALALDSGRGPNIKSTACAASQVQQESE